MSTAERAAIPPLILAVEPDSAQATQLCSILRSAFGAEVVLAASASDALVTLSTRVPDLVLTSALLPPRDETTLAQWLRTLGVGANHVQTVTIPVLAIPEPGPTGRAKPSQSRDRTGAAPDACDPQLFADWVAVYLDLARLERQRTPDLPSSETPN